MLPKYNVLTDEQVRSVHEHTMRILEEVGVEFTYEPALAVFREHGLRVDGQRVYFTRDFIEAKIKTAPSSFRLRARDPKKTVVCGDGGMVLAPGYGAPYIYTADCKRRLPVMEDYDNIVKLAGASENFNSTGGNVCEPMDTDESSRHIHMLYSHIRNSDKTFMGSSHGETGAKDSLAMAEMLYGGSEEIKREPALASLINSITPLKFDNRMLAALMTYAEAGQCNVISALVMAGTTGPVTLAGTLSVQNAEVLAGIALTQCIRPGAPVVYGSASAAADLRDGSLAIGNPETALLTSASAQLGRFYNIPVRGGGCLSDAKTVDGQAGYEGMMTMLAAAASGISYVLHAGGILESYTAISLEKLVMDDEILGMVRRYARGFNFDEERFVMEDIAEVGPSGHYLYQESTMTMHADELRIPGLSDRRSYIIWENDMLETRALAKSKWERTLASYEAPPLDDKLRQELERFIKLRSDQLSS